MPAPARAWCSRRAEGRGAAAASAIRLAVPQARLDTLALDLASLESVRAFATRFSHEHEGPDLLVNNAGIMATPHGRTTDVFERQFGANDLGHFALTGLLVAGMVQRAAARIVTVSSMNHFAGRIAFDDLQGERRYRPWAAYNQSKLANLLFAFDLDRRLRAGGARAISLAAHPGYAATGLQGGIASAPQRRFFAVTNRLIAQNPDNGALPVLYAATFLGLAGGEYVGPGDWFGLRGRPAPARASIASRDPDVARHLWEASEHLTGVTYELEWHSATP